MAKLDYLKKLKKANQKKFTTSGIEIASIAIN